MRKTAYESSGRFGCWFKHKPVVKQTLLGSSDATKTGPNVSQLTSGLTSLAFSLYLFSNALCPESLPVCAWGDNTRTRHIPVGGTLANMRRDLLIFESSLSLVSGAGLHLVALNAWYGADGGALAERA